MNSTCQNCKKSFSIEPEDFDFYKKVSVPPPTFCPDCRLQRRLAFFNWFNLYKRKCDLCGELVISMYRPETPYKTYCPSCWWSDTWDPFEYGRDYDFSRPFFEQFRDLWRETPMLSLSIDPPTRETSPYVNHAGHLKNCYLVFHADFNEDMAYGFYMVYNKMMLDSSIAHSSELCYDSMHTYKVSRGVGLQGQVTESVDVAFLKDSVNCQNCFASANLRNKKYHIFNTPHTKEEYFQEIKKWDLGSYSTYQEVKKRAEEHWKKFPPKPRFDEFAVNCTGNYVFSSKNCRDCREVVGAEDSRFLFMIETGPVKDCYDVSSWGNNMSLSYECCNVGENVSRARFCNETGLTVEDVEYSKLSTGGSHHFGCVSTRKNKYCILNRQYSEEEFFKLREKIITHMNEMPYTDKKGRVYRYGEFFPAELSPFAYNETIANKFFPRSKEEVQNEGWEWHDEEPKKYTITKPASDLPDHIKDAKDDILKETFGCGRCGRGFKVIPMELSFLRRMNLPLLRECPFCRIDEKFTQWVKNLRIFKRICSRCSAEFETSYPEEEVKEILCKKCYLEEII